MTDFITSIVAIRKEQDGGHAEVSINGDNFDTLIWHDGNPTNITQQQILDKQVELKADFAAKQYQIDRKIHPDDGGYPTIADQLDMMWHDKKNGTTTWEDAIQTVKDANPKGE